MGRSSYTRQARAREVPRQRNVTPDREALVAAAVAVGRALKEAGHNVATMPAWSQLAPLTRKEAHAVRQIVAAG